jgi:hypothetical protein
MGWIYPNPTTEEEEKAQREHQMAIFKSGCLFYILFALLILFNVLMGW